MEAKGKRNQLVRAVKAIGKTKHKRLGELKRSGRRDLRRSDFVWHILLQSAATLGNSRGWGGLIGNATNYNRVTFEHLARLNRKALDGHLSQVLANGKVRMPQSKARNLARSFDLVQALGGLRAAKAAALRMPGREAKIAFMKLFPGPSPLLVQKRCAAQCGARLIRV